MALGGLSWEKKKRVKWYYDRACNFALKQTQNMGKLNNLVNSKSEMWGTGTTSEEVPRQEIMFQMLERNKKYIQNRGEW